MTEPKDPLADAAPQSELTSSPALSKLLPAILLVLGLALSLRLALVNSAPWLDELWSLNLAQKASASGLGLLAIFQIKHDNNHILNTLWLSQLGASPEPWLMRLPSLIAGLAAIATTMLALRRWGWLAALSGGLWFSASALMLSLTTQARGYGGMLFCALAAAACLLSAEGRQRQRYELAYRTFACIGLFFHLAMVHALGGFFLFSAWRLWREREARDAIRLWLRLNLLPLGATVLLWFFFVRGMEVGALVGPKGSLQQSLIEALAAFSGSRSDGGSPWLGLALLFASVVVLWREGEATRDVLVLALLCGFLAPALILLALRPPVIYARYFLPAIAILALIVPIAISCYWRRGQRLAAIFGLLLFLKGHIPESLPLLRNGHGAFPALICEVHKQEPEGSIIGCSYAGYIGLEEAFHRRGLEQLEKILILTDPSQAKIAGWWVVPAYAAEEPVNEMTLGGQRFQLFMSYEARPWSGFPLHLYRRVDP